MPLNKVRDNFEFREKQCDLLVTTRLLSVAQFIKVYPIRQSPTFSIGTCSMFLDRMENCVQGMVLLALMFLNCALADDVELPVALLIPKANFMDYHYYLLGSFGRLCCYITINPIFRMLLRSIPTIKRIVHSTCHQAFNELVQEW